MSAPAWTPTQQVRALLLLHETSALIAAESRACSLHGHPQLAAQLAAVGKRNLPQALVDMADWSPLRLAGAREHLRSAVAQYRDSSAWAERLTAEVAQLLRQGQRFADASARIADIAQAIAADHEDQVRKRLDQFVASLVLAQGEHAAEDAEGARIWTVIIERVERIGSALGLPVAPTPPATPPRSSGPPAPERATHSSTPYQPSSATELGSGTGGSHALRRRR